MSAFFLLILALDVVDFMSEGKMVAFIVIFGTSFTKKILKMTLLLKLV